jgi:hypothetical protein
LGGEFQVNTYTTGYQQGPSVASDPSGNFVVAWTDGTSFLSGEDGSLAGIFGQRFSGACRSTTSSPTYRCPASPR